MIRNDLWLECSLYVWKTRHKVGVEATKSRPGYLSSVLVMSSLLFAGGEVGACWQVKSSVSCNNCNIKDCSRLAGDTPVWSAVNRKYLYWFFVISVLAVFFVNYITGLPPIDQLITTGGAQDWATLMERNDELFIVMLYNYLPWPEDKCDLPLPSLLAACWFLLISWWGDWGTFLPSSPTQLSSSRPAVSPWPWGWPWCRRGWWWDRRQCLVVMPCEAEWLVVVWQCWLVGLSVARRALTGSRAPSAPPLWVSPAHTEQRVRTPAELSLNHSVTVVLIMVPSYHHCHHCYTRQ